MKKRKRFNKRSFLFAATGILIASLIVLLFFHTLFFFTIEGDSMTPLLQDGDRIIVKTSVPLNRFDTVVFQLTNGKSDNPSHRLIVKRLLGLPGDRIEFLGDRIRLNNHVLSIPPYDQVQLRGNERKEFSEGVFQVPAGKVFVIGDNLDDSVDSRHLGFIPISGIVGTLVFRFWPLSRFGPIPSFNQNSVK